MERQGEEIHVETEEARAGETPHVVRYILIFGLVLTIAALTAVFAMQALTSKAPPDPNSAEAAASPSPTGN